MGVGATLAGVQLQLRDGESHGWSLVTGVHPHVREFQLSRAAAAEVWEKAPVTYPDATVDDPRKTRVRRGGGATAGGGGQWPRGPVTLELQNGGAEDTIKVEGLYLIARGPGDDRLNTASVLVADSRWLWRLRVCLGRYNVRRRAPLRRWLNGGLVPLEVAESEHDVTYERATLRDGVPWDARGVLDDVLGQLCKGTYLLGPTPLLGVVQDTELSESGDAALARVLALVPGVTVYVDYLGITRTTVVHDGSERPVFARTDKATLAGNWGLVDRSVSVPRAFMVGFEREHELRFNYSEDESGTPPFNLSALGEREDPLLEQVIPSPDPNLTVDGQVVAQGTWLRFYDQWLPAVNALADYPALAGELTAYRIRRWWLAGFSALHAIYSADVPGADNRVWTRRLGAIEEHWRGTFRILPAWMDKFRSWRPVRAAIVSTETGARARSEVYTDYVVRLTYRGLAPVGGASGGQKQLAKEVTGTSSPSTSFGITTQITDGRPAPFYPEVVDEQLGLLRIVPKVDLYGFGAVVAPGDLGGDIPATNPAERFVLWHQTPLAVGWEFSIVLSCVPSVPADHRRLWWEKVEPREAVEVLKGVPSDFGGPFTGPVQHLLCGDETAKFVWSDDERFAILDGFWSGKTPNPALMLNQVQVRDSALAQAARALAPLLPRVVGRVTTPLAKVTPTGNLQSVTHEVRSHPDGAVAVTTLDAPHPQAEPFGAWSLLPERTRKILAKLVDL